MPAIPGLPRLTETLGAAFRSSPVEHVDGPSAHLADALVEPAGVVAGHAEDAAVAYGPTAAQKLTEPEHEPEHSRDGDPLEPGRQPPGDPLGPDDGPHWTVSPFAPDVPIDGDPVDLDTVADLADVTGALALPDLVDGAGLGDVVA